MSQIYLHKLAEADPACADAASAPICNLVLLHGFLGAAADWQPLAAKLRGVNVYAADLPGHGHSAKSDPATSFRQFSLSLQASLRSAGLRRYLLLGYSLGGRLALSHACRYPQGVQALILESAHPGLKTRAERGARRRQDRRWQQRLRSESLAVVLGDWYRQAVFESMPDNQRKQMIASRRHNDPQGVASMLGATSLSRQPDMTPFLKRLNCPVHYFCGNQDPKFMALAREMQTSLPDLHLHRFENAGHNIHAAQPECYAEQLQNIIERCRFGSTSNGQLKRAENSEN